MFCLDTQLHCCVYAQLSLWFSGSGDCYLYSMTLSALSYLSIVTIGNSHVVTVVVECNCITNKMLVCSMQVESW